MREFFNGAVQIFTRSRFLAPAGVVIRFARKHARETLRRRRRRRGGGETHHFAVVMGRFGGWRNFPRTAHAGSPLASPASEAVAAVVVVGSDFGHRSFFLKPNAQAHTRIIEDAPWRYGRNLKNRCFMEPNAKH